MNKYKVAYISGESSKVSFSLEQTIENINNRNGEIKEIVQSQSMSSTGTTIVTITIIYSIRY
ncbi:hypothetical protein QWY99_10440 [Flavobacterium branchiarum]|uniref:hypothetical protein n=1 Tax=Flavobacterium branchiarum TaxID=1114870 RepID=UPI0025B345A6|nr:hypothetical protein [Flavobacterium branchiarum]MDN3673471.1 hypothetical protein [Flavobacterium branchiarum]